MANKSKAKGTRAETKIVKYLNTLGIDAKRQPLKGNKDEGDIIINFRSGEEEWHWIIEVKAGKQTANPSRSQIEEWLRQTSVETMNSNADVGILIVVRYGRKLVDADVYKIINNKTNNADYPWSHHHFYFDDWANHLRIYSRI